LAPADRTTLLDRDLRGRAVELAVTITTGLDSDGARTCKPCSMTTSSSWPVSKANGLGDES
jgi:hypothetical protein